jgi:D-serine deaminase-like pyridoxal phosphate-dependent protein
MRLCSELSQAESNPRHCKAEVGLSMLSSVTVSAAVRLEELSTPAVLVDRRRLRRNIDRMQQIASDAGIALRPHAKTHKSPTIARWQLDRGAVGICCAKLGEAEIFAQAGVADIRLPYPILPIHAARVLALMDRAAISIIVDHVGVAGAWSDAMLTAGRSLDVLVKVDVGFHRCGIDPAGDAIEFIQAVGAMKGLRVRGLLSHAGHGYRAASVEELTAIAASEADTLRHLKERADAAGVPLNELSVGATPTFRFSVKERGITELRPGNYVYFDRTNMDLGSATLEQCALTVLATVVSKPSCDRIILDCGSKTLSSDLSPRSAGYGVVLTANGAAIDSSLSIDRLSEEHATVGVSGRTPLEPGDRVRVLPNHSCVVSNLVDSIHLVDGDEVVEMLPVAARGRSV